MITYFFGNTCTFFSEKVFGIDWTKNFIACHILPQGELAGSRDWLLSLSNQRSLVFPWQSKCGPNFWL